jgi:hypothetical protein
MRTEFWRIQLRLNLFCFGGEDRVDEAIGRVNLGDCGRRVTKLGESFGRKRADGGDSRAIKIVAKKLHEAAGDGGTCDGDPIDGAGFKRFGDIGIRRVDIPAFVNNRLLD